MTFRKRLMYYMIGVGLGVLGVAFLFKDRGCAWTPANRVLTNIGQSQIMISDSMRCVLRSNEVKDDDIFQLFKTGNVNFKESRTQAKPKVYLVEGKRQHDGKDFGIQFVIHDSISHLSALVFENAKGSECKGLSAQSTRIFDMPEETIKKILKTKEIIASDSMRTVVRSFDLKDGDLYNMIEFGSIDFEQSEPNAKPNAIYFLTYKKFKLKVEMSDQRAYLIELNKD